MGWGEKGEVGDWQLWPKPQKLSGSETPCGDVGRGGRELCGPTSFSQPLSWGRREGPGWEPGYQPHCQDTENGLCCCNNGLTGLLGRSTQESRGRHADPEAGGYPVLCPPGGPRRGLPATSLQVSAHPTPRHGLSGLGDGICFGFSRVFNSSKRAHWCCLSLVSSPHLPSTCTWVASPSLHPPPPLTVRARQAWRLVGLCAGHT